MKIIADTNIWYGLGQEEETFKKVRNLNISPTFVNIHELSKSENLIDKEDLSRAAIRRMFHFRKPTFEPPFIYLALLHQEHEYDIEKEIGYWLDFTSKFAKGYSIASDKAEGFRQEIEEGRKKLKDVAEVFNEEAEQIRSRILNKKQHKKLDTYQITAEFLNHFVMKSTNDECNIDGFDLDNIELLIKTLDHFFKTLETSQ